MKIMRVKNAYRRYSVQNVNCVVTVFFTVEKTIYFPRVSNKLHRVNLSSGGNQTYRYGFQMYI
jgi:hypothetical protein